MQERLSRAKTIAGTQILHSFVPFNTNSLHVHEYSPSNDAHTENVQVIMAHQSINICDAKGYATAIYEDAWWLGYVTGSNLEAQEVTLSFLHPHGPSKSFYYPQKPDILTLHICDILTLIAPVTYTGRTDVLTDYELNAAALALKIRQQ